MKCEGCPHEIFDVDFDSDAKVQMCLATLGGIDVENCHLTDTDKLIIKAMIAGQASCSYCGNWSRTWMECDAHKTENPTCICDEFDWQPREGE